MLKKYPSLKSELTTIFDLLDKEPAQGVALGNNCYKIRIAIASKNKGKSGGARLITHIKISKSIIYILSIFDKSDQSDIDPKEIISLLKLIEDEE